MISRRDMLKNLSLTGAGLALSNIIFDLDILNVQAASMETASLENITSILENEFNVDGFEFIGETQLLTPRDALLELNRLHGLNSLFSDKVDYSEASQCTDHFKKCEKDWRFQNLDYFTNVQRSKIDRDIAYMLGGVYDQRTKGLPLINGATQYQNNPAVRLTGDTASTLTASVNIYQELNQSQKANARAATLTEAPSSITNQDGYIGDVLSTPSTEVIRYRRPVKVGRKIYDQGIVGVRPKNTADKWKFKGLYV